MPSFEDKLVRIAAPTLASLAPSLDTSPDQLAAFYRSTALPFIRHSPLPAAALSSGNAVSNTTAKKISQTISAKAAAIATNNVLPLSAGKPATMDEIADGVSYVKTTQQSGTAIIVDNGNFEASVLMPPPGWAINPPLTASYDTTAPFSGTQSLKVNFPFQFSSVNSTKKWSVRVGDAFRITCQIKSNGTYQIYAQVVFLNAAGAFLTSGQTNTVTASSWTLATGTCIAPANAISAQVQLTTNTVGASVGEFDNINVTRNLTSFEVTPINTAGTPQTTSGLCTQAGTGTTINVASSTWQFGDGTVSYNSGTVNPGSLGTWYVYASDPAYLGGTVTYLATGTPSNVNSANGLIFFGKITTTSGGSTTSTGGGSGGGGPVSKASLA